MTTDGIPFLRLRSATGAELAAFETALGLDPSKEAQRLGGGPSTEALAAVLSKSFEDLAEKDYLSTLKSVAGHLTTEASWKDVELKDTTNVEWLENYIFRLYVALHVPNYKDLPDAEKSKLRAKAVLALMGDAPSADEETAAWWTEAAGAAVAGGLAIAFGWWFFAGIGALTLVALLLSPSMTKLVPATLILINVRKRIEFEAVLRTDEAAWGTTAKSCTRLSTSCLVWSRTYTP